MSLRSPKSRSEEKKDKLKIEYGDFFLSEICCMIFFE